MNSRPSFFDTVAKPLIAATVAPRPERLLDTTKRFDALRCGYDGPCDPVEDGEGLIIQTDGGSTVSVSITSCQGYVELIGEAEIKAVIYALQGLLGARG